MAGEIYGLTPGNVVRQHLPAVKSTMVFTCVLTDGRLQAVKGDSFC